ncbi:sensor domain-containing phosphodiesterase [Vibrio sinaloensis]|uniref:sensor domain-containing phosphodiesterase n=1 Tax=Photobacterium sp. (strain ATCC 43367) TaxID=379097 RepID=UPI00204EC93D|nr:EAL domain-containing protein [Vibrio sinaloensis]UPQ89857.1 EAL domain-containing protein [Vibrio sinaloensis]
MSKLNTSSMIIPAEMSLAWQEIVNLLAEIVAVPAALIMRIHQQHIEVFSANNNHTHPYQVGDTERLGHGLYCETVVNDKQQLLVSNAELDQKWCTNPDIKLGMIAYCGLPLQWPNGDVFGTICVLDDQENPFNSTYQKLLASFRDSIEAQLTTLYQNHRLQQVNAELKSRVKTRTQDLVELNYSLNQEIDKRRAAERKIRYQQRHDIGTGFLNRAALEAETEQRLHELADNSKRRVAVIHIGFTNGRRIQAKYGYAVWESILVQFRNRLIKHDQLKVITARPSSNDLVFVLESRQLERDVNLLCRELVDVSQSEFLVDGEHLHLHSYIGVADSDDTRCGKSLLKYAIEAMQSCKDSGHKFSFYCQDIADTQKNISQLESYLLQAVRNDDLLLYFQPKVSPVTHQWIGAEALLRWRHPILGDISNETLIHLAEQNGLIFEVGSFVLRSAIQKASEWLNHVDNFKVSINISAVQLQSPQFVNQLKDLLASYQLPASYIELEVTESGLIADEVVARNTLSALSDLGITLSLDDFGTGYASFNYLKKFPFDAIKIDKSFIQQLEHSEQDKEIVRSIITIAKKLDLQVTVEGIETTQHESFIVSEECDYGQGYLYGKPMPCDEFESHFLHQNQHPNHLIYS